MFSIELNSLIELAEKAKGTDFEPFIPYFFCFIFILVFIEIMLLMRKIIIKVIYIAHHRLIKNEVYVRLSFMESADIDYAIHQFIPTRFSSRIDPGCDDEPAPVYVDDNSDKQPLLIEHFIKFELDLKIGKKYCLCLAGCGMGKTTFLINLFCRILKQGNYQCEFISLQDTSCLEKIEKVEEKGKTVLLLDALDENEHASTNYIAFVKELERKTQEFYRVIITSRTNFFENESEEHLSEQNKISGTASKLSELHKFYITPFTDDDIKRFLRLRYHNKSKREQALEIINQNKNLSVRPLLLRFMDELLIDGQTFEYDFQLYESLFHKWIEREKESLRDGSSEELYNECQQMAKSIYYQWMKSGRIGIYLSELIENISVPGLKSMELKGHAMLSRTRDGLYKFSHKSYWEYMLAKLALTDMYFASDLLIRNFERAESFLKEMIQYYQTHQDEQTPEICMGIAIYLMKYKKIEDAEKQCRKAIDMCDDKKQLYVLAMIILAECLHRQFKYKSEERVLKNCRMLIKEIPLMKETVLLYVRFGMVFAKYCRKMHLKSGQDFLSDVIEFCNAKKIKNYLLLRCYESYCHCCMNYHLKQERMNQMEQLIREYFQDDQYAIYLRDTAQIWKLDYKDRKVYELFQKIVESNMRFMDLFEQMAVFSNLGISCAGANSGDSDVWNDIVVKRLEDAWKICGLIYTEEKSDRIINNPYALYNYQKFILACEMIGVNGMEILKREMREIIDEIIKYIEQFQLQEEMWIEQIELLEFIRGNELGSFSIMQQATLKQLKIAEAYGSDYEIIDAYWHLYALYNSHNEKDLAQDSLKCAYDLTGKSDSYRGTKNYCQILYAVLNNYVGEADKAGVAQELMEAIPGIFGSDTRRSRIYCGLKRYFCAQNDIREMEVCFELLCCKFNYDKLKCYYDCCMKYQNPEEFIEKIDVICLEKGLLSDDEILSLSEFIDNNKNEMEINITQNMEKILKRMESLQRKSSINVRVPWSFH